MSWFYNSDEMVESCPAAAGFKTGRVRDERERVKG